MGVARAIHNFNFKWYGTRIYEERLMLIRLMFEPKTGVNCNVNEMFKCYAENYLSDFPNFKWAGYIVMNVFEMKYNNNAAGEPLYQFIATDATDVLLTQIKEYVKTNPMHGYYTHIHYSINGENEKVLDYDTQGETN